MDRLINYFVPEKYILDIKIDKKAKTLGGTVVVEGRAKAENIKFHAVGLSVDQVAINGKKAAFEVENGVLTIFKAPRSDLRVEIDYHGSLNENMQGAYLSTYKYRGETEVIVATQFESHYAREAFPCIDEPEAKAVFEVSISIPDKDDLVLANMPVLEKVGDKTTFQQTPKMSTYLLAWVIGKFHGKTVKNAHGVEITTYCSLAQDIDAVDFANEIAAKSLEFYDDNFGVPYPLTKLDQVALPDFDEGAMENWGLVTYRESMMLVGKDATMGTHKMVAMTVAHELSHQWFGDLVTMKWWDDLWLNESFATIMEYFAVDAIHPEFRIFEAFFTRDVCVALNRDAYTGVQPVHQSVEDPEEIETLFDGAIVYAKGARLMLMLIRLMGWEEFCKGLKDYFEKHKYGNTEGDDLWQALTPYAKFDPKGLMHAFIDRPGYPVISDEEGRFDKFSQKRFLLDGPPTDESWPVPEIVEDMSGHYILNLTEEEFAERLANFEKLGLEEKLRLLIDRELIVRAGMRSAADLIPLAMKFKEETSAAVWSKIATMMGNLKVYVDDDSAEERLLKKYVGRLVDDKLKEVGVTTRKEDDENVIRLRANLLALDYYAEDEDRLCQLAEMYQEDYHKMDSEIRTDILSAKVYLEPEVVGEFIEKYCEIANPEVKDDYLMAATLVRDEKELDKLIDLLGENDIVKPQDQFTLFLALYQNYRSREKVFDWLINNWETVKRLGGDKSLDYYPIYIARLARTRVELEKYRDFFGAMKDEKGLKRAIEIGEREIEARLKLIEQNKDVVVEALRQYE
ncbi:M1 family metallopeptidase [Candidatus Saccharibacteria bacterium]|nr:M1 family metallopeptidase [Candidatus Saccharibacteria bacterium]